MNPAPSDPRLAQLERIVASDVFSQSGRLSRFLRFAVEETVAGRGAAIKEYLIGVEVYERPSSFDPKTDSTVRSEAVKLRQRLTAYYDTEAGKGDAVVIAIPKGAYVPTFEQRTAPAAPAPPAPPRPIPMRLIAALSAAAVVLGVAAWLIFANRSSPPAAGDRPRQPIRLTHGLGLDTSPAISRELVAYAADRSGRGDFDIWVQTLKGGDPLRVTDHEADDIEPDLSPDGGSIAFRSNRDGGGIYVAPSLGGAARLFAKEGRAPRFSPDGASIAFHVANEQLYSSGVAGGALYVAPAQGGPPRRIAPKFSIAVRPLWTPDGRSLIFLGYPREDFASVKMDWFAVPLDGGAEPVSMGFLARFEQPGACRPVGVAPGAFDRGFVLYSASCQGIADLWRIPIDASARRITGGPERLTTGSGVGARPSVSSAGVIAYARAERNIEIWSLPLDRAAGPPRAATGSAAAEQHPAISRDGRSLVFTTMRSGNEDIWFKDLATGQERPLADGPRPENYALLSGDGREAIWAELIPDPADPVGINHVVWSMSIDGGPRKKLCEHCAFMGYGPDGKSVLDLDGRPIHIALQDTATGKWTPYLKHPRYDLMLAATSPDGRWLAFVARLPGDRVHVFLVPFVAQPPAAEKDWIALGEGDMPVWSADGATLYFVSLRDGHRCVWARRIEAGKPAGAAFAVAHFHAAARRIAPGVGVYRWMSAAVDKLVLPVAETRGNIWLLK